MKKIALLYFSGTGNTEIIAELLAGALREKGAAVDLVRIEDILKKKAAFSPGSYDLVGIGYPNHAMNAPRIVFDLIKTLPVGRDKKTFIFKSTGDPFMNGGTLTFVRRDLLKKGYKVFYECVFPMPPNVIFKIDDALSKKLCEVAERKTAEAAGEVLEEKQRLFKAGLFSDLMAMIFSAAESSGARMFGRHMKVSSCCNLCGICVKNCPTGNISESAGRIKFGYDCILCTRCIYACPKNAISPGFMKFFVFKDGYDIRKIAGDRELKGEAPGRRIIWFTKGFYEYLES